MSKKNHTNTGRRQNKKSSAGKADVGLLVSANASIERAIVETLEGRQMFASVAPVASLTLINADNDQVIATDLQNGAVLNLATLPTRNLSIRADMGDGQHESVKFTLDGKTIQTESIEHYAIAGNDGDDYFGWTPSLGSHKLTVTPYSSDDARGTAGASKTINFTVIDDEQTIPSSNGVAAVQSLSLINADTDEVISSFTSGMTLDFSKLPTRNLSIREYVGWLVGKREV